MSVVTFRARCRFGVPDGMEDDFFESGIAMMPMGAPAGGVDVHFDVAADGRGVAELNDGAAKIGAAFAVEETGVEDADGLAVGEGEPVAAEALVLPDGLQEVFGRRVALLVQQGNDAAVQTPLGVCTVWNGQHLAGRCAGLWG